MKLLDFTPPHTGKKNRNARDYLLSTHNTRWRWLPSWEGRSFHRAVPAAGGGPVWHQPSLHGRLQQITAGEAAGLKPLGIFSSQLSMVHCGLGRSGAALPLAQCSSSLTRSCSVRLKAAQRLLLCSSLRAKERKSFLPGPKTKPAQQNPCHTEPQKNWAGRF